MKRYFLFILTLLVAGCGWDPAPGVFAQPEIVDVKVEKGRKYSEAVVTCEVSRMEGIVSYGVLLAGEDPEMRTGQDLNDNVFSVRLSGLEEETEYHFIVFLDNGQIRVVSDEYVWTTGKREVIISGPYEDDPDDDAIHILIPPDDEIWYESHSGNTIPLADTPMPPVRLISNTYEDGKGIYKFSEKLTDVYTILDYSTQCMSTLENEDFKSLFLPASITHIGEFGLSHFSKATTIVLPYNLSQIDSDILCGFGEWTPEASNIYFIGETAPSFCSTSLWNMKDKVAGGRKIDNFFYPEGNSSYSNLLRINIEGNAVHKWVPTKYQLTFSK